jgi:Xaa-Pro aminopeptidase
MNRSQEFQIKLARMRAFMEQEGYGALLLGQLSNIAWACCGADTHVVLAGSEGIARVLVTPDRAIVLTTNIEAARLAEEELTDLPVELVEFPWWEDRAGADLIADFAECRCGADVPFSKTEFIPGQIRALRTPLTEGELARYRVLGAEAESALRSVACRVAPGLTEFELAGMISAACLSSGLDPYVILVAADERIARYRHPIPTFRPVERAVMLVLCARQAGLICSLTRLVSIGPPSKNWRRIHRACTQVDATMVLATREGHTYGDVFRAAQEAYAAVGFADEWCLHHQGGPTGYEGRDFKATPECSAPIAASTGVAWNPSITGTKSEDTILTGAGAPELISAAREWPMLEVTTPMGSILRPDILER